jgi:hypothetical protein
MSLNKDKLEELSISRDDNSIKLSEERKVERENKDLLLKDLTERLIYHVVLSFNDGEIEPIYSIRENGLKYMINDAYYVEEVKPYLFPLSSMTEEQTEELRLEHEKDVKTMANCLKKCSEGDTSLRGKNILYHAVDWCNKNHFDYRGLIEKGLAIDATNLNIY